jgi:hypothetical protein
MAPRLSKSGKPLGRPPNPVPNPTARRPATDKVSRLPKIAPAFTAAQFKAADKARREKVRAADANLVTKPAKRRKEAPKRAVRKAAKKYDKAVDKAFPLIARNDLRRLLEEAAILNNRASSANGSRSQLIAEYVKTKHLHAGAFRIVSHWAKLGEDDPQKLWLELAHVDDMREKAGIDRLAEVQGQLLPAIADEAEKVAKPAESAEPDEVDDEPDKPQENAATFPREVQERAGDAAA